jgi:hypothetical protein
MAEYFLKLTKFYPTNSDPQYIGPFAHQKDAIQEVDDAMSRVPFEIVIEGQPKDFTKAVQVEVLTHTAARATKKGLRLESDGDDFSNVIGKAIPDDFIVVSDSTPASIDTRRTEGEKSETGVVAETKSKNLEYEDLDEDLNQDEKTGEVVMQTEYDYLAKQARPTYRGLDYSRQAPSTSRQNDEQFDLANKKIPLIVVGRHYWNADWLKSQGIIGRVVDRVNNIWEVQDRTVYGIIPPRLAIYADRLFSLDFKRMRYDFQNRPLSVDEMNDAGAYLLGIKVLPLATWEEIEKFLVDKGYEGEF